MRARHPQRRTTLHRSRNQGHAPTSQAPYPGGAALRIAIFIALLPPEYQGGAELQAARLAREMAARGHEVHVFARRQAGRPDAEMRDGVQVHRRAVVSVPGLRLLAEVGRGAWQARGVRPDVILCYMTLNSGLLGAAASALCGAPFVVWLRAEGESLRGAPRWEQRAALWVHRRAARIWVQADSFVATLEREYMRRGLQSRWAQIAPRVQVLGNGLELPPPQALGAPGPRFLFVGRLVREKDLQTLVAAAHQLGGAEVWLAGDGPLRLALEAEAAGAPVRFLGAVPPERIPALLQDVRGLVLCSRSEGVPNVVLEALAHGRPVVSTPVGAIPDLIQDGVNGCLVPVGDANALAAAMRGLLDDRRWGALATAARPSVARFAWPDLVTRVEAELAALATPAAARRAPRPAGGTE